MIHNNQTLLKVSFSETSATALCGTTGIYLQIRIYIYLYIYILIYIYICIYTHRDLNTSSMRTRRGGSCLRFDYKTFFICRTCTRRAPARPVRACFVRTCCTVVVQEHDLRATTAQCNAKRKFSSYFTLHSLHTSSRPKSCKPFSPHPSSAHLIPMPSK